MKLTFDNSRWTGELGKAFQEVAYKIADGLINAECVFPHQFEKKGEGELYLDIYQYDRRLVQIVGKSKKTFLKPCQFPRHMDVPRWVVWVKNATGHGEHPYSVSDTKAPQAFCNLKPEGVIDIILKEPTTKEEYKEFIIYCFRVALGIYLHKEDFLYDYAKECYCLREDVEKRVLDKLIKPEDVKTDTLAKYTSLNVLAEI